MLKELERVITRLESSSLSSAPLYTLKKWHERFVGPLERIRQCSASRVMRILTEEAIEDAEWILRLPSPDGTKSIYLCNTPEWDRYVGAVSVGYILDTENRRYIKAKNFADKLLEHTYTRECKQRDYKAMRYEYALSPGNAPEWFQTDKAALWAEEIVTAYCFITFSVMDFAEEYEQTA